MSMPTTGLVDDWDIRNVTGIVDGNPLPSFAGTTGSYSQGTASAQGTYRATGGPNSVAAVELDGVDDHYAQQYASATTYSGFTVSYVVKSTNAATSTAHIVGEMRRSTDSNPIIGYLSARTTNNSIVRVTGGSFAWLNASPEPDWTVWHVIDVVYDGTNASLYVDGTLVAQAALSGSATIDTAVLGADWSGTSYSQYFAGTLTREVFWDHGLDATERADWHSVVEDTYGITVSDYVASGGTEVDAGAAPSWTSTFTADTNLDRQAGATLDTTASFTADSNLERQSGGTLGITASFTADTNLDRQASSTATWAAAFTADANMDRQAAASPSWSATFTAEATVFQPSSISGAAALNIGATFTAEATLDGRAKPGPGTVTITSASKATVKITSASAKPDKGTAVIDKSIATVRIGD